MVDRDEFDPLQLARKDERFRKAILKAQWYGGTVQFGTPGQPGSYTKTFEPMRKIDHEIHLEFVDGEPQAGFPSRVRCTIGETERFYDIEPTFIVGVDKVMKRSPLDYPKLAEAWAIRKWHLDRGTPVSEYDHTDTKQNYLTEPDFVPPKFVWHRDEPAQPEPAPRRGRPPKTTETVAA